MFERTELSETARAKLNEEVRRAFDAGDYRPTVVAIVHSPAGCLLVQSAKGEQPWGFVQGGIEAQEDIVDALRRELREEVGICCYPADVPVHCMTFRIDGPGHGRFERGKQYFVFHVQLSGIPHIVLQADELACYEWCTPRQAMGVIMATNHRHAAKRRLLLESFAMAFDTSFRFRSIAY